MKYAAIAHWAATEELDIKFMCEQLDVSRSGYYKWLTRQPSERDRRDVTLTGLISAIHAASRANAGVRRVHAALRAAGHLVGRRRVLRLMQAAGLAGRAPRACKQTTVAGADPVAAPDLLERDFTAQVPSTRWCGDITYIKTWDGWAYLATVIDLYNREVVGFAVADHMRTDLVIEALQMAITHQNPAPGVIFHSDRGTQYTSATFAQFCAKNSVRRSLGRTGICYDNAVSESFFATIKKELIHTKPWPGVEHVRREVFEWIEGYFNTRRRHSTLGYLTPQEFRLGYRHLDELSTAAA